MYVLLIVYWMSSALPDMKPVTITTYDECRAAAYELTRTLSQVPGAYVECRAYDVSHAI